MFPVQVKLDFSSFSEAVLFVLMEFVLD